MLVLSLALREVWGSRVGDTGTISERTFDTLKAEGLLQTFENLAALMYRLKVMGSGFFYGARATLVGFMDGIIGVAERITPSLAGRVRGFVEALTFRSEDVAGWARLGIAIGKVATTLVIFTIALRSFRSAALLARGLWWMMAFPFRMGARALRGGRGFVAGTAAGVRGWGNLAGGAAVGAAGVGLGLGARVARSWSPRSVQVGRNIIPMAGRLSGWLSTLGGAGVMGALVGGFGRILGLLTRIVGFGARFLGPWGVAVTVVTLLITKFQTLLGLYKKLMSWQPKGGMWDDLAGLRRVGGWLGLGGVGSPEKRDDGRPTNGSEWLLAYRAAMGKVEGERGMYDVAPNAPDVRAKWGTYLNEAVVSALQFVAAGGSRSTLKVDDPVILAELNRVSKQRGYLAAMGLKWSTPDPVTKTPPLDPDDFEKPVETGAEKGVRQGMLQAARYLNYGGHMPMVRAYAAEEAGYKQLLGAGGHGRVTRANYGLREAIGDLKTTVQGLLDAATNRPTIQVQSDIRVDGKKIAQAMSTHQEDANRVWYAQQYQSGQRPLMAFGGIFQAAK